MVLLWHWIAPKYQRGFFTRSFFNTQQKEIDVVHGGNIISFAENAFLGDFSDQFLYHLQSSLLNEEQTNKTAK